MANHPLYQPAGSVASSPLYDPKGREDDPPPPPESEVPTNPLSEGSLVNSPIYEGQP